MNRQEAIEILTAYRKNAENIYRVNEDTGTVEGHTVAFDIAIKALQGDMYCSSCGVRLVPENEYVEPKPFEEGDEE